MEKHHLCSCYVKIDFSVNFQWTFIREMQRRKSTGNKIKWRKLINVANFKISSDDLNASLVYDIAFSLTNWSQKRENHFFELCISYMVNVGVTSMNWKFCQTNFIKAQINYAGEADAWEKTWDSFISCRFYVQTKVVWYWKFFWLCAYSSMWL